MPYDDVLSYYSAADLFFFPSEGDIWGLVVNEALSMGLPVICTSVIGASELVENGINGFKVTKRSPHELCRRLEEILEDNSLLVKMKRNAGNIGTRWNSCLGVENLARFVNGKY
jgi:glycosyltransferase involved in cell wall biosynthesis